MREDSADENSAGHRDRQGQTAGEESREVNHVKSRDEQSSHTKQHVPRRISGKTTA